ncbi:unnamed protein product [Dibothriocephalus latus]|uniref:Uncharacterized protein n=1 Tax=Dibothriocephalus latus TaxID=60516 RepID=A0A3P7LLM7_DIBLA|nr:unnamed protein product [Dibothriocephalus latus]
MDAAAGNWRLIIYSLRLKASLPDKGDASGVGTITSGHSEGRSAGSDSHSGPNRGTLQSHRQVCHRGPPLSRSDHRIQLDEVLTGALSDRECDALW